MPIRAVAWVVTAVSLAGVVVCWEQEQALERGAESSQPFLMWGAVTVGFPSLAVVGMGIQIVVALVNQAVLAGAVALDRRGLVVQVLQEETVALAGVVVLVVMESMAFQAEPVERVALVGGAAV